MQLMHRALRFDSFSFPFFPRLPSFAFAKILVLRPLSTYPAGLLPRERARARARTLPARLRCYRLRFSSLDCRDLDESSTSERQTALGHRQKIAGGWLYVYLQIETRDTMFLCATVLLISERTFHAYSKLTNKRCNMCNYICYIRCIAWAVAATQRQPTNHTHRRAKTTKPERRGEKRWLQITST